MENHLLCMSSHRLLSGKMDRRFCQERGYDSTMCTQPSCININLFEIYQLAMSQRNGTHPYLHRKYFNKTINVSAAHGMKELKKLPQAKMKRIHKVIMNAWELY